MPFAITMDKRKILGVVIFIGYQIIEYHQTIHFFHLGHIMSQSSTYLKNMGIVNAGQAIISSNKAGDTDHM